MKISSIYSTDKVICANYKLPVTLEACCRIGNNITERNSLFSRERVTFATAKERCSVMDPERDICDFYRVNGKFYLNSRYFWTNNS